MTGRTLSRTMKPPMPHFDPTFNWANLIALVTFGSAALRILSNYTKHAVAYFKSVPQNSRAVAALTASLTQASEDNHRIVATVETLATQISGLSDRLAGLAESLDTHVGTLAARDAETATRLEDHC